MGLMATTKKAPRKAKPTKRKTAKRTPAAKKKAASKRSPKKAKRPAEARGRKPDAGSKSGKIRELMTTGMKAADIAKKVGCTVGLVYNVKARASGAIASGAKKKKRRPGRPRKAGPAPSDIAGIVAAVKASERETASMRAALERVQAVIADALE